MRLIVYIREEFTGLTEHLGKKTLLRMVYL